MRGLLHGARLCVTIEPTSFIYKGGRELGVRVGLINYPRFPAEPAVIFDTALELARQLRAALHQWSFSVVATDKTVFETTRVEAASPSGVSDEVPGDGEAA